MITPADLVRRVSPHVYEDLNLERLAEAMNYTGAGNTLTVQLHASGIFTGASV